MRTLKTTLLLILFLPTWAWCQVIINEVQTSNTSTIKDNFNEYEDWIELYNSADTAVEIGGWVLKDNVDTWAIPTGDALTLMAPGSYFLLWADDQAVQGKFHTNFKLSANNGEFLGLYQTDSVTLIQSVQLPPMGDDDSYQFCVANGWEKTEEPSPLQANDCGTSILPIISNSNIRIYPTISAGEIQIEMPGEIDGEASAAVFSNDGRLVFNAKMVDKHTTLSLNHLPQGIYIIQVTNVKYTSKTKFMKR